MECAIYNLQFVGKNETSFNIRLKNHRKDMKDPKAILADEHFQKNGHRFKEHARFTMIGRLINTNGLVVKVLDFHSRGSMFKTTEWLQG